MRVLGVDVGVNSLGWALMDLKIDDSQNDGEIIDLGIRLFPKGVKEEKGNESPKNLDRRTARSARRNVRRRAAKKKQLLEELTLIGLWPSAEADLKNLLDSNPYELRAKALDEELSNFELGRVLLHLAQRKGYLSNSKDEKESETVGKSISELKEQLKVDGYRTLGEYLFSLQKNDDINNEKLRNRYTSRQMYLDEFQLIWDSQSKFKSDLLTKKLLYGVAGEQNYPLVPVKRDSKVSLIEQFGLHGILFFQRAVYWDHETIGECSLEPSELRASKAHIVSDKFRIWNDINNLKIVFNSETKERLNQELTQEQREQLFCELMKCKTKSFKVAKKSLGIAEEFLFNYEHNSKGRDKLLGSSISKDLSEILNEKYGKVNDWERSRICELLIDERLNEETRTSLLQNSTKLELTDEEIEALSRIKIKSGRMSYSTKAMSKLIPFLEKGHRLETLDEEKESARSLAGYEMSWHNNNDISSSLPLPPDMLNPVVNASMTQIRKVMNAVVKKHGKPEKIVVELSRDSQRTIQQRADISKDQSKREKTNDKIRKKLIEEFGISHPKMKQILRYKLWEEQSYRCVYSLDPIRQEDLFSGKVHIDHIYPRWRSMDDSYLNKVLCFESENREKGDLTPSEWLNESNPDKKFAILQFLDSMTYYPFPKKNKIIKDDESLGSFTNNDLSNTRYIAREAKNYFSNLVEKKNISVINGKLTSQLRYKLGLHNLLDEKGKTREDHRHHAIDAVVVGLTNPNVIKLFSDSLRKNDSNFRDFKFEPVIDLKQKVQDALDEVLVSVRPTRKKRGQLHDETIYGATQKNESPVETDLRKHAKDWVEKEGVVSIRKSVESLSKKEIGQIKDRTIREILEQAWQVHGDLKSPVFMPSGRQIKKVRIAKKLSNVVPRSKANLFQLVDPGNNFCFVITINKKGKWEGKPFPLFAVGASRVENEVMRLFKNDTIRLGEEGSYKFYRVTQLKANGQMKAVRLNDARKADEQEKLLKASSYFQNQKCVKVEVDPVGEYKVVNYFTE